MTTDDLARSNAFRTGLAYLETGYFWECHEVLEAVWLACPDGTDQKRFVQALIQLANAHLKHRMQRPNAVRRLCAIVRELLAGMEPEQVMGLRVDHVLGAVRRLEREL